MAGIIIFCTRVGCQAAYVSVGERPTQCPTCQQPTTWTTLPPEGHPDRVLLKLTVEDFRWLRSIRISPL